MESTLREYKSPKAVANNHFLKGPIAYCHRNGGGCAVNGTAVATVLIDQSRSFMNLHIRYVYWIAARLPSCEIWEFSSPALGKVRLFRTFCICFYDIALWTYYTVGAFNRFASCYYKCMKCFFGHPKCSSVTNMLFELGLPSFNTLIHNSNISFANSASACDNTIVQCVLLLNS